MFSGVGDTKLSRYGTPFIEAIQAFRKANPYVQQAKATPALRAKRRPSIASATDGHPVNQVNPGDQVSNSPAPEVPTYIEEARKENPRAYEKWSDEEDARLRQAWEERDASGDTIAARIRAIAADFCRQPSAIRSRLKKLGLVKHS